MPDADRPRPAEAGHLQVAGQSLEYRHWGPPPADAPTLVLLHEGLGCVSLWRDFPERLAAATGWGVFAYSRAGYGGSSPCDLPRPLTYMHEEAQAVLPALLDAIGLRRGVLLGHSDGASIAAIYAGARPDPRVRGLVLMAPHFFTEESGLAAIAEAREAYAAGDLRDRLARHHGGNVDCAFRGWNDAWLGSGFRAWDITEYLPAIALPVLVLQGEDDQYGTLAQVETARDRIAGPVTAEVLADCRHSPQRDRPEASLLAIGSFLESLNLSKAPA